MLLIVVGLESEKESGFPERPVWEYHADYEYCTRPSARPEADRYIKA